MNSNKVDVAHDTEDNLLAAHSNNHFSVINNGTVPVINEDHSSELQNLQNNKNNDDIEEPIVVNSRTPYVVQEASVVNSRHESPHHRKQRKKSHLVIYATTFIMSIGFSIILTGVWPYLQKLDPSTSKEFFGWVVAANPLGQMIASPLLGWYGAKIGSNRCSFLITIVMFIGGNVLYAVLPLFHSNAKFIMLISRFIVGISSANIAVCRSYISYSTKQAERTIALSITAASQSMGFILGPSIQTALAYAHPLPENHADLVNGEDRLSQLGIFNMYSLTGWFTALLGFLNFFLLLPCVYKEFSIAETEELKQQENNEDNLGNVNKTDYVAVLFLLISYFCILLIYVIVETLIVPMCMDLYAWTDEFTVQVVGLGLTVIGIIAFFMFILGGRLARLFNDRKVFILIGLVPLAISLIIFLPLYGKTPKIKYCSGSNTTSDVDSTLLNMTSEVPFATEAIFVSNESVALSRIRRAVSVQNDNCKALGCPASQEWCFYTPIIHIPQLIVGACVMTIGYPVSISLAGAIVSKMLKSKEQGLWMGILTSVGSFSRFVGPVYVSYMYTNKGPLWTFGTLFGLLVLVLLQNIVFYKRLKPLVTINVSTSE